MKKSKKDLLPKILSEIKKVAIKSKKKKDEQYFSIHLPNNYHNLHYFLNYHLFL